jgi:hypothetical protein
MKLTCECGLTKIVRMDEAPRPSHEFQFVVEHATEEHTPMHITAECLCGAQLVFGPGTGKHPLAARDELEAWKTLHKNHEVSNEEV